MNYQKFILSLCMASMACISLSSLAAAKIKNREYVDAKAIQVTSKGIFLKKKGKKVPIEALHTDENSKLFIVKKLKKQKNSLRAKVYCPEHNRDDGIGCQGCRDDMARGRDRSAEMARDRQRRAEAENHLKEERERKERAKEGRKKKK
jgi:hypothetical protein